MNLYELGGHCPRDFDDPLDGSAGEIIGKVLRRLRQARGALVQHDAHIGQRRQRPIGPQGLEGAPDIVSAYRFDRTAEGPIRTVYSVVYNLLIRFLFPLRVKDVNFSFKLFKREVLDTVVLEAEGSFIDAELLSKGKLHGFKIVQFGVNYFPRNRGTSTLASPDVIFKMIRELVSFRMKMRHEIRAARISAP